MGCEGSGVIHQRESWMPLIEGGRMIGYILGFISGLLVMKYMENQEFKAKVHQSVKDFFKGGKKRKK